MIGRGCPKEANLCLSLPLALFLSKLRLCLPACRGHSYFPSQQLFWLMRRRGGGGGGSGCGRMVLEKKLHQQPSEGGREGLVHTPSSLLAVVLVLATGTEVEVLPSLSFYPPSLLVVSCLASSIDFSLSSLLFPLQRLTKKRAERVATRHGWKTELSFLRGVFSLW